MAMQRILVFFYWQAADIALRLCMMCFPPGLLLAAVAIATVEAELTDDFPPELAECILKNLQQAGVY